LPSGVNSLKSGGRSPTVGGVAALAIKAGDGCQQDRSEFFHEESPSSSKLVIERLMQNSLAESKTLL
jgi:hypothetical protein